MNLIGFRNIGYDILFIFYIFMVIVILSDVLVVGIYVWLYW